MMTFTFLAVTYVINFLTLSYSFPSLREGLGGGGGHQMITESSKITYGGHADTGCGSNLFIFLTYTNCDS